MGNPLEAHDDETKETAAQVLSNAVVWFAERSPITGLDNLAGHHL